MKIIIPNRHLKLLFRPPLKMLLGMELYFRSSRRQHPKFSNQNERLSPIYKDASRNFEFGFPIQFSFFPLQSRF